MDWLTFQFCVIIWIICVGKSQSQLLNNTNPVCRKHQRILPPDQCNKCICFEGQIYCTHLPCPEQECTDDEVIPRPDECNRCVCRRGKVLCTEMFCIPAPNCVENKLYPSQNRCNSCICLNGFILCTSYDCDGHHIAVQPSIKPIIQETTKPQKPECNDSLPIAKPNECVECNCHNGMKICRFICNATLEDRIKEPECVSGQHIPKPDACNNCICFEGQIHCSHIPCQIDTRKGPECTNDQAIYRPDECNECYCFEGRLKCSDLVCIRDSKCFEGQVIAKPDSCNFCKCFEGHILCTNYQCPIIMTKHSVTESSSIEVQPQQQCQPGDDIPPPPPPDDCNTCFCLDNRVVCTMIGCVASIPEIKARLKEDTVQSNIEVLDKKISVDPFIVTLYKNYDKKPTKLIHTHAYNGFHQEIKVHSNSLPKDATKLLKALASSLDNPALAGISYKISSSSVSLPNNHAPQTPFVYQVNQSNLIPVPLSKGNAIAKHSLNSSEIHFTDSSKLITSGSQSNDTFLVLAPSSEPSESHNSVLPRISQHKTYWNYVSSPAPVTKNNIHQIYPYSNEEERLQEYYYDNTPSVITSIDQNKMIRNPSFKFGRPGHHNRLPINHTRNTEEIPNRNTQFTNPLLPINPKPININDGEISYTSLLQENNQNKKTPSMSHPGFQPGQEQFIEPSFNKGGQLNPTQFQYQANPLLYSNQFKQKPDQTSQLNNKSILYPPKFQNNPNRTISTTYQNKPPQFGLKPGQQSLVSLNNHTVPRFKSYPESSHYQMNALKINQPYQEKHMFITDNEGNEEPHQEQHKPHSKISYVLTKQYNPPQTIVVSNQEKTILPQYKGSHYNITHFHYKTHPTITYVSEYDPAKSESLIRAYPPLVGHGPYQNHNASYTFTNESYLPENVKPKQGLNELDLTMSKVIFYLNLPNVQINQNDPSIINYKFTQHYPSHAAFHAGRQNDTLNVYPKMSDVQKYNRPGLDKSHLYKPLQSQLEPIHYQHIPEVFEVNGEYNINNLNQDPINAKGSIHKPSNSQSKSSQNQHLPGVSDRGSADGKTHKLDEDLRDPTGPNMNQYKRPPFRVKPPQNQHMPELIGDLGPANGFQYSSNLVEDTTYPKRTIHLSIQSKFKPVLNQHIPGVFDDHGSADGFHYPVNSAKDPTHHNHPRPHSQFKPPHNQHMLGVSDDQGSANGFQYTSNSAEDPTNPKGNMHKPPHSQFKPSQNQNTPGVFDDRGSTYSLQYPSNSVEDPTHPEDYIHSPMHLKFEARQKQHISGVFSPNFGEHPTHSNLNIHEPPQTKFEPSHNQLQPGVLNERGSNSAEHPENPKNQSQQIPVSLPNKLTDNQYNNYNPLKPQTQPDHGQYEPSFIDKGIHNIPWSLPDDHKKITTTDISNPQLGYTPDHNQYKPLSLDIFKEIHQMLWPPPKQDKKSSSPASEITTSFFPVKPEEDQFKPLSTDNLLNGFHQIPWYKPEENKNVISTEADPSTLKPNEDQYEPSATDNPSSSIPKENEKINTSDKDENQVQIEQDISTPVTDLIDFDSNQYNRPHPWINPDSESDSIIPDNNDQLYPSLTVVKKISEPPPIDDSEYGMGSIDQLDPTSFLFPSIAKSLNNKPSPDQDNTSHESHEIVKRIFPWSNPTSKNQQLPAIKNVTVTKKDINMFKIFNLLSKLTSPQNKFNSTLHNITNSNFNPETIENIINDFNEEQIQTTTQYPRTESTSNHENRLMTLLKVPVESRLQALQVKYPDVHIILHQPNLEDDADVAIPQFIETDAPSLTLDMSSEDLGASLCPKIINPRYRHRPKVQKEECGEGTQWINNCHGCSCHFGQAKCIKIPDCHLRSFGEPMICKPYSHFKMGDCYTCECNGDGVAECDATDCKTEVGRQNKVTGSASTPLSVFNEFFDDKKTNELIQYYSFYKKLPKACPSKTVYPTCEPGTSWVSSCHKCQCNMSGQHECSPIDDCKLDFESYGKPSRCKPNSKFYPKTTGMPCVECSCNDEGNPDCPSVDHNKH